ncbi:peptidase M15B and M15C DD-carboxypeptidase VanY/endolysin [Microseira wollei NIES-4236]|uniref:Peptidase M15B and M15C DD-carboxypeptidase VanY/endolysin n=1 Tax=Microseira wollei NIES-4236 TaxID=2530354 RepID=A0AAV3WLH5_9CYAN|nr:M15 family metallopeptidase [Microseira wollei]GET41889.1 peptidase M15B and M15C DD-carboxypeptidase VanY/endolysin [Microseira wollei NIES-4236]
MLDNAGFSEKPSKAAAESMEDIPEALRDASESASVSHLKQGGWLVGTFVGLGAIALTVGTWLTVGEQLFPSIATAPNRKTQTTSPIASPFASPSPKSTPTTPPNSLLGHLAYPEAPAKDLQAITANGQIKLRKTAAQKFMAMTAAARAQGVIIVPISGFRSVSEQQHLFFDVKAQRNQVATERAAVSAPPGYSEHHTGYAVDIGDGRTPATNLSQTFEQTAAYKWLAANAARYSFEMSFPKNNTQGVSYEPWHWRFVGDRHSLETFYQARQLSK